MNVSKAGHCSKEYEVTVTDTEFAQDIKIYLYGDANGDGKVNFKELGILQQYLNGWSIVFK